MSLINELIARVRENGPIDMYLSEEEYSFLKERVRRLWCRSYWTKDDKVLVLAFFRGYTFYRELSEDENRFWKSCHEELQLEDAPITNHQYELLWDAFESNEVTNALKVRSAYRREFVRTIDEVWGIRSLNSARLVSFFIEYYREHPGKRLTPALMRRILGLVDDAVLRQAASFDRVFTSMTHAVDVILENELEGLPLDALEAELELHGVDLGRPNALRYFANKRAHAVQEIIGELRQQRTPAQFVRYLRTIPGHTITLPTGTRRAARVLAETERLPYGRYVDHSTGEEHHVTPAARISLNIIGALPLGVFKQVAGVTLYVTTRPFTAQVGNRVEASVPLHTRTGVRNLWCGNPQRGVPLSIDGYAHPDTVGYAVHTCTHLMLHNDEAYLQGKIDINAFLPDITRTLTLQVGAELYDVRPQAQGQSFTFRLPAEGVGANLENLGRWSWHAGARLFSANGIEITRTHLRYGPKSLYLVSERPPNVEGVAHAERLPVQLPLWRITWDGSSPLIVGRWRIDEPYAAVRWTRTTQPQRIRDDVTVHLHPGYFTPGQPIVVPLEDNLPMGTRLRLGSHTFVPHTHGFHVTGLLPGKYAGEFILNDEVVGELEPFRVVPHLTWDLTRDPVLVQGRTQGARAILPNESFAPFRWKPLHTPDGEPKCISLKLTLDDESEVAFDLRATCVSAQFVKPETTQPLEFLRSLRPRSVALLLHNPYARDLDVQLRLASRPEEAFPVEALHTLQPAARDSVIVEVCLDKRTQNWVPLTSVPVRLKPVVTDFELSDGFCRAWVIGPHDVTVRVEEFEPHSGRLIVQMLSVTNDGVICTRLNHPQKLRSLHVRLIVSSVSAPNDTVCLEKVCPPLLTFQRNFSRGLAWSRRQPNEY